MSPINKNDRRYQRTHALIKETAFSLAEKSGWKKVSVTELTQKADLNRNTFYLHYEAIEDVFDEFEAAIAEEYFGIIESGELPGSLTDEKFFNEFSAFIDRRRENFLTVSKIGRAENLLYKLQKVWKSYYKNHVTDFSVDENEKNIVIQFLSGGMYTFFSSLLEDPMVFDTKKYFFYQAEIINKLMHFS